MVVALVDPLYDPSWQELALASPQANIFHHAAWLRLLHEQYRYEIVALCVLGPRGRLRAGIPLARVCSLLTGRRYVCLPFSDRCGPIGVGAWEELGAEHEMLQAALWQLAARERLRVEVRDRMPCAAVGEQFVGHRLALAPSEAELRRGLTKGTRAAIGRARREGVSVSFGRRPEDLATFFELHLATRRRLGLPTQPRSFIMRFAELLRADLGFVALAHHRGAPVAGGVFFQFNGTLLYKYGATSAAGRALCANHALLMSAIEAGRDAGLRELDFGRSELADRGLRSFKRSWGAEEHLLAYSRIGARAPSLKAGEPPRAVPRPLRRLISHSPPLTGRVIGAALYRHTG
ncbi:MAG TPA: GNAT family N-acetyltransferase [Solirubrobacteraceae bacterium]|nr:GNAT family N-acetyltransferase [Solirubrobacteraceae bacterium]